MITIDQTKILLKAFVADACHFLNIDSISIRVVYSLYVEPFRDIIPQYYTVLQDDTIVIGEDFLKMCSEKGCTMLRSAMYSCVRFIAKRRDTEGYYVWPEKGLEDAMAFSMALMFLRGLQIPCPSQLAPDMYFSSTLALLSDEFDLKCRVFKTLAKPSDGAYFYKVNLDETDCEKLFQRYIRRVPFTAECPIAEEKGTLKNPFDNVYEAVDYLKQIETEAFNKDSLLQDISNMDYFYDLNQNTFRISFASPYVAHLRNKCPTKSFVISQLAPLDPHRPDIFYFSLKPNLYGHKFLYRGQSDHYADKPCVPNLYRDKKHNEEKYYLDFLIFSQEMEIMIKSLPIVQLLEQGVELHHDIFRIRMHYGGLTQHYYNKSCFLDLTSDLEVMKFFATTEYDSSLDQYYPNKDINKTGVIYYYEMRFPEAFKQHKGYAVKTIGKQLFMRSGAQSGFLLEMSKDVDFKKLPEVKAVYFKHDPKISEEIFVENHNGEDYFAVDLLQHAWHNRLRERYSNKVVSQKAVELNVSRNPGETVDTITTKLNALGIKVDAFIPEFTADELDDFYKNIDVWWINFCEDIYFSDAENELYRQLMKDIRNRDEYKWAFKRNS